VRAKKRGITVVAITQRPALLRSVDKIMVLNAGTVQALGKRDDILPMISGQGAKPTPPGGNVLDSLEG
jgi:ATP-binding cassette subfamily C protein